MKSQQIWIAKLNNKNDELNQIVHKNLSYFFLTNQESRLLKDEILTDIPLNNQDPKQVKYVVGVPEKTNLVVCLYRVSEENLEFKDDHFTWLVGKEIDRIPELNDLEVGDKIQ